MKQDKTNAVAEATDGAGRASVLGALSAFHTLREVHVPGEYVLLRERYRMIRPGRLLL
jgi:hypothetical protein